MGWEQSYVLAKNKSYNLWVANAAWVRTDKKEKYLKVSFTAVRRPPAVCQQREKDNINLTYERPQDLL